MDKDEALEALELFKDKIPNPNELAVEIGQMLADEQQGLIDIQGHIAEHIYNLPMHEVDIDDEEECEAGSIAIDVIENLIDVLEVNAKNCKLIHDYIFDFHSYNGFDRLITFFESLLTKEEMENVIEEGRRIFVWELTEHWD